MYHIKTQIINFYPLYPPHSMLSGAIVKQTHLRRPINKHVKNSGRMLKLSIHLLILQDSSHRKLLLNFLPWDWFTTKTRLGWTSQHLKHTKDLPGQGAVQIWTNYQKLNQRNIFRAKMTIGEVQLTQNKNNIMKQFLINMFKFNVSEPSNKATPVLEQKVTQIVKLYHKNISTYNLVSPTKNIKHKNNFLNLKWFTTVFQTIYTTRCQ